MEDVIKDDLDNLFNVDVGNEYDYVGFYIDKEEGRFLIDRTDSSSYTNDFIAESKAEAISLLFEKIEEMVDEVQSRISEYYSDIAAEHPDEKNGKELKEKLEEASLCALYNVQRTNLKTFCNEDELKLAELKHNELVERYALKEVNDISFTYYK
ncbi:MULTISPECIES: hypothetical protein [Niallia]|uniref:Uncharacterized protein n=1 Tax=Niallia hominis TaxID=3133173 RepID=A0ABV1EW96_9BACI|nr:hypothetical protein [Niallia circulans]MCF2650056.1 hypothetical protein [Niallia circulans]